MFGLGDPPEAGRRIIMERREVIVFYLSFSFPRCFILSIRATPTLFISPLVFFHLHFNIPLLGL